MPTTRFPPLTRHPPTRRSIDLIRPAADPVEAEALRTAYQLNRMSTFDYDGDPTRLDWREWRAAMADPGVYPNAKRLLWRLHPHFFKDDVAPRPAELHPRAGELLQQKLASPSLDPEVRRVLERLTATPGFGRLAEEEQLRTLHLVGTTIPPLGEPARQMVVQLMTDRSFARGDGSVQVRGLRELLAQQPWLDCFGAIPAELGSPPVAPYTIEGPTEVAERHFRLDDKVAPALRYDVVLESGHRTAVYMPKTVDPDCAASCPTVEEYATAIASLPPRWAPLLSEINVAIGVPPEGGFMGVDSMEGIWALPVSAGDQSMLSYAVAHEVGHLLTMHGWGFTSWDDDAPEFAPWRAAQDRDGLYPTAYARTLVADDAAEMLAYCAMARGSDHEAELRELFPARMALIDNLEAKLFSDR